MGIRQLKGSVGDAYADLGFCDNALAESFFATLKCELIDHSAKGHLFISVLAYHFVHTLWLQLKARGIDDSWEILRGTLAPQQRVTATLQRRDGRTSHVRTYIRLEPKHHKVNEIPGLAPNPGGIHRVLV